MKQEGIIKEGGGEGEEEEGDVGEGGTRIGGERADEVEEGRK